MQNTQLHVLDTALQPVPIGICGELCISGPCVAMGYWNRPGLTAERFVSHSPTANTEIRLYKSGDMVRRLTDGNIEFLGRDDGQIKIRGYRVEIGEAETVLRAHADVRETVIDVYSNARGEKELIAYVLASKESSLTQQDLGAFMRQRLPHYMVPSGFSIMDEFPRTPSGKLDRARLTEPDTSAWQPDMDCTKPTGEVEEALTQIWEELFGIDQIGVHRDFFELGGHSLLAFQILSRVNDQFSVRLSLRSLFEASTVAELAEKIIRELSQGAAD
jgi:acyl carrier protein